MKGAAKKLHEKGMLGLPEGACVPLPMRRGRGGVVAFSDAGFQHADPLWHAPAALVPDEAAMAAEERAEERAGGGWVLAEIVEWVLADGKPCDWRAAGRRMRALAAALRPGLRYQAHGVAAAPEKGAARGLDGLFGELGGIGSEQAGVVVEWLFGKRMGQAKLRDAVTRIYLLAMTLRPELLRITGEDGRPREMSLGDLGPAFGEGNRSRAKWQYRAKILLDGLPKAAWQRGEETREKCRRAAKGNRNRRRKELLGASPGNEKSPDAGDFRKEA